MSNFERHQLINQPWPEAELECLGSCPLCGSDQRVILHEGLRDRAFYCAPGLWSLYRCGGCKCVYLDPRPTPESMHRAYAQYYTHHIENNKATASLLKITKQAVKNGYLNRKWGTNFSPSSQMLGSLLPKYLRAFFDGELMRNLPKPAGGRSLLDVGCGSGQFLLDAENAGWRVTGFDLDSKAIETARSCGLNVYLGDFETLPHGNDCFDAITVSHVIEHTYNPKELLANCYRLLKPGGFFWIETPNIDSYGHSEFKGDWRGLESPRHLQLLSWELLQRMLEDAGFIQVTQADWRPKYLAMNCASKAIKLGVEPGKLKPMSLDRIKSIFVELRNRGDRTRREFITLQATK